MRLLLLLPLFLSACFPTGTGNPLQDASPGSDSSALDAAGFADAGPAFDAGQASDGGPAADGFQVDGGPTLDGFGVDSGTCADAGPPQCGTAGGPMCECLADESVTLGDGRPELLVDHDALDGRVTLVRRRQDETTRTTIEALVVMGDVVESVTELATNVLHSASTSGEAISVAVLLNDRRDLRLVEVDVDTGVGATPLVYQHPRRVGEIDVARSGGTTAVAFSSGTTDEPIDGRSVFVLRAEGGVFNEELAQHMGGLNVRALAIAASGETWLLAVANDDSVFTLSLDAEGEATGVAQEVAAVGFVSRLDLTTRDGGFFLAYDGVAPAIHALDTDGVSVEQRAIVGRVLALEWSESGFAMMLRSDTLSCASEDSPLIFERFRADFMPLHDPVRVGFADYAAAVTLLDGNPWVANSTGTALNFVNACLDDD